MLQVSSAAITRYKKMVDRAMAQAKRIKEERKEAVATVVQTSEISATSFLFGLAQGKFGGIELVGLPVDLISGLAMHILGFAKVGGSKMTDHLHAFGDGALASFFGGLGRNVGYAVQTDDDRRRIAEAAAKRKKKYATLPGGQYSFGMGDAAGGAALADEDLARMVAAGRR